MTNETSNEKGSSNEGHKNNSNPCLPYRSGNRYSTQKFKGKVQWLLILGVKEDKHTDSFMVFYQEVHLYILANCKHLSDIAYLVKELKGPLPPLMKNITNINSLKKQWGIDPKRSGTELAEDENTIVDNLQELLDLERKLFFERKSTLEHNISKIYGLVWGQLTLDLKEDVIGLDEYGVNSNEYN